MSDDGDITFVTFLPEPGMATGEATPEVPPKSRDSSLCSKAR